MIALLSLLVTNHDGSRWIVTFQFSGSGTAAKDLSLRTEDDKAENIKSTLYTQRPAMQAPSPSKNIIYKHDVTMAMVVMASIVVTSI